MCDPKPKNWSSLESLDSVCFITTVFGFPKGKKEKRQEKKMEKKKKNPTQQKT